MKQTKVSEATPIQLDWLVAKCEGKYYGDIGHKQVYVHNPDGTLYCAKEHWTPSTNWAQGGPIVEKELINLITTAGYPWRATMYMGGGVWIDQHGPTPLIAAMRCYICSVMGDVVEVPEELG